jgi:hypothetical protein
VKPEVVFSLLFVAAGATVVAVEPRAWPGAGMMALIGAWGLWEAARTALLRRRHPLSKEPPRQ